jgi:hypothetical protein
VPIWVTIVLQVCLSAEGAVQRRLTICSDPPGAVVYVDNYEIGTTPISTNFLYYGTRQIRLVKDGYETLTVLQPIPAPWYDYPVLDFFSENLTPGELRDHRTFNYRLVPQAVVPNEVLRQRAEELRGRATASGAVLTMPGGSASVAPATAVPRPAPEVVPAPAGTPGPPGAVPTVPGTPPAVQPIPSYPPSLPPATPPTAPPAQPPISPPGGWTVPRR